MRTMWIRMMAGTASIFTISALHAGAIIEQTASVTSGGGACFSNATEWTAACVGQPGTVSVSANAQFTHYAGFLGGAFLRPGETNAHGIALEADPDNDDDGLMDSAEVSGSAFGGHAHTDPNAADTDEDGMDDGAEAAGMYDPNDPSHRLEILLLTHSVGNLGLSWIGKGGGTTNTIRWGPDLVPGTFTGTVHSAPYPGGDAPWFKQTNTYIWAESGTTTRFYQVRTE